MQLRFLETYLAVNFSMSYKMQIRIMALQLTTQNARGKGFATLKELAGGYYDLD